MKRDIAGFILPNGTIEFIRFKRFPERVISRKQLGLKEFPEKSPIKEYVLDPRKIFITNFNKGKKYRKFRCVIFHVDSPFPLPIQGTVEELRIFADAMAVNRADTSQAAWYGAQQTSYLITVMASIMSAAIAALITYTLAVHQFLPHP